jgi:tetratricopeptide (TPR) repeat protein
MAIKDFEHIITINSSNAEAWCKLGICFMEMDEMKNAIPYLSQAIVVDPYYAVAYASRGGCYLELDDFENAKNDLETALSLTPNDFIAMENCANAYFHLKLYNESYHYFKKCYDNYINRNMNNGVSEDCLDVILGIADSCHELKKYSEAADYYTKSIELKSTSAALYDRAYCYYRMGKYKEAVEDYSRAIITNNDDLSACYNNRGTCFFKLGDYNKAIEDFNTAIELEEFPDECGGTYYSRGESYFNLGEYNLALKDFIEAKKIGDKYDNYVDIDIMMLKCSENIS